MESTIKEKILEKIKEKKVKMKPKFYFLLRTALLFGVFVLGVLFSIFILSFIHFRLISSGLWYLPKFGFEGFFVFLKSFPWSLIVLVLILIFTLEILSRKYSFSFKIPILFSILGIFLIVLFGSFIFAKTQLHSRFFLKAKEGKILSPISPLYLKYGLPGSKEFHRGIVEKISPHSLFIRKANDEILEVKLEKPLQERIEEGDSIVIFGKRENGKIMGKKFRKIKDGFSPIERKFFHLHKRKMK